MNLNIEKHNRKFHVGAIIQGAEILKILKYSKNGKSTQFLYKCPICGKSFVDGARIVKLKTCPDCNFFEILPNQKTEELKNFYKSLIDSKEQFVCERLGRKITSGVYGIFSQEGIYIGESLNIRKRWEQHIGQLVKGEHSNFLLQNCYDKGEKLNFKILEGIEIVELKDEKDYKTKIKLLNLIKEAKYIDYFHELGAKIFNLEKTLFALSKCEKISKMFELIEKLRIENYQQLKILKNEQFASWEDFKELLKTRQNNKNDC